MAGGPLLGGWLRLDGDDATPDLPMPGREVALAFDRPGRLVRLSAEGPAHSGGALPTVSLAAVDTGGQVRLWLPDEASALLVDRGSGAPLRVPLQGGETSLSVRLP